MEIQHYLAALEWWGYEDIARYLVEKGASLDVVNAYGHNLLHQALYKREKLKDEETVLSLLELLIDKKITNINSPDKEGETPLYVAAKKGYFNIIKMLVDNNIPLFDEESSKQIKLNVLTAILFKAVEASDDEAVKWFLSFVHEKHKHEINELDGKVLYEGTLAKKVNITGETEKNHVLDTLLTAALFLAFQSPEQKKVREELLVWKAKLSLIKLSYSSYYNTDWRISITPLEAAILWGSKEMQAFILKDIDSSASEEKNLVLQQTVESFAHQTYGYKKELFQKACEYLLVHGCRFDKSVSYSGTTVLDSCLASGTFEKGRFFIKTGIFKGIMIGIWASIDKHSSSIPSIISTILSREFACKDEILECFNACGGADILKEGAMLKAAVLLHHIAEVKSEVKHESRWLSELTSRKDIRSSYYQWFLKTWQCLETHLNSEQKKEFNEYLSSFKKSELEESSILGNTTSYGQKSLSFASSDSLAGFFSGKKDIKDASVEIANQVRHGVERSN